MKQFLDFGKWMPLNARVGLRVLRAENRSGGGQACQTLHCRSGQDSTEDSLMTPVNNNCGDGVFELTRVLHLQ